VRKESVFTAIREDVEKWVQKEVNSARFRNRSHATEYALMRLMVEENKG
jgi:hypothetical protein